MRSEPESPLTPLALLVIGYLAGRGAPVRPAEIAQTLALSGRSLREVLDELRSAGRLAGADEWVELRRSAGPAAGTPGTAAAAVRYERWQTEAVAALVSDASPGADVTLLHGQAAVREELGRLYQGATAEVLSVTPRPLAVSQPGERNVQALAKIRTAEAAFAGRGVHVEWISHADNLRHDQSREVLRRSLRHGEELHSSPYIATRMVVVDRRVAVVPVNRDAHAAGAVVLQAPDVIAGLVSLFRNLAHNARRLRPDDFVKPAERDVLRLLARGSKDEAIARRLGISTRTVRRTVADLLATAGAESRFQLALHALQVGWLSPDDLG